MKDKKLKPIVSTLITLYTALLVYWMFFGFGRTVSDRCLYNFVPFRGIYETFETYMLYVKSYPNIANNEFWRFAVNIFGNIGVFVPFGILLPIISDNKFIKSLTVFEIGLITLETAQLITRRGVFDVDDIILNTIGFLIGCVIITNINKIINKINSRGNIQK